MNKVFSKVFGLFATKVGTPPTPAAESNLPSETCSAPDAVADQNKSDAQGGSSGASARCCCGKSETRKLPSIT